MKKYKVLATIILTFFFTTIFFTAVISFLFYKSLDKYNDTRLNPIQIDETNIDSTKTYDCVLLGDSHVQFWNPKIKNSLNLGVSGQTSEQIKLRYQILKSEIKNSKKLIISIGANDVKSIATNPETKDEIIENCLQNIDFVITENKPNFKNIYILTIPPDIKVSFPYNFINYKETYDSKEIINQGIRKLAKKYNLILIDTSEIFKNEDEKNLSTDGIHMNEQAYKVLNKLIN
jgi:lysophospholipase L1-like esterase